MIERAYADGRLNASEHVIRIRALDRSWTPADLDTLTRDLADRPSGTRTGAGSRARTSVWQRPTGQQRPTGRKQAPTRTPPSPAPQQASGASGTRSTARTVFSFIWVVVVVVVAANIVFRTTDSNPFSDGFGSLGGSGGGSTGTVSYTVPQDALTTNYLAPDDAGTTDAVSTATLREIVEDTFTDDQDITPDYVSCTTPLTAAVDTTEECRIGADHADAADDSDNSDSAPAFDSRTHTATVTVTDRTDSEVAVAVEIDLDSGE